MREWKPQYLLQLSGSYWAACVLHAAVHLNVFSCLYDGPDSPSRMAAACDCDERGMNMLVTALCSMNLLRRTGASCELTPFARQYLCRQSPDFMGYIIEHHRDLMFAWSRLDEAVRTGGPVRGSSSRAGGQERESFLMGMHNVASAQAAQSVPHIDLEGRGHLLDLGGGPATYSVHFCRYNPQLRATVFDLPASADFARKVIAQNGMQERIGFAGGDFMVDALPQGCDVVWISQILHAFGPEEAAAIIAKAVRAAAPGALLLVQEFIVDDDRNGPEFPALFGLNMLAVTRLGQAYTGQEIAGMLHAAGARDVRRLPLALPQGCGIIRGVTP